MVSTSVVLPWSTWAIMAMFRISWVMFLKRLKTKIAAETTSSPDESFLHRLQVRSTNPYFSRQRAGQPIIWLAWANAPKRIDLPELQSACHAWHGIAEPFA